ncbi:MAG TPA: DUF3592 domain-containing protein [Nitrospirales bacterium]|jgi:hypothetical protein|nr:DUF3592 domain-containing protein [Nitrospirales bacterium]
MPQPPILKLLSRSVLLWVGAVFFAVGVMLAYFGLDEWRKQQFFEKEAAQAQGTVVSKSLERATREGNPRTKYLVSYRFSSADGQTVEQTGEVSVDEWERLDEGSPFTVTYLPSDPNTARTDAGSEWWAPLAMGGFGSLFAFIGIFVGQPELRRVLLVLRLSRSGLTAEGTVAKVWATGTSINRVCQWQLSYEFRDPVGRTQQGESDLLTPDEAASWEPGNKGAVRFDREHPEDSVWVGRSQP